MGEGPFAWWKKSFPTSAPVPSLHLFHDVRQEHDDLRKGDHESRSDDEGEEERKDPLEDLLQGDAHGDSVDHVDIDADRRRDDTHLCDQNDDDAKPDGVVSQLDDDRIEDGNRQHDEGQSVDETPPD